MIVSIMAKKIIWQISTPTHDKKKKPSVEKIAVENLFNLIKIIYKKLQLKFYLTVKGWMLLPKSREKAGCSLLPQLVLDMPAVQ